MILLSIRVNEADRYYPVKVEVRRERIRSAMLIINEKVCKYKQRYVDKDTQDFLCKAPFSTDKAHRDREK
jgi:hypothetical protein